MLRHDHVTCKVELFLEVWNSLGRIPLGTHVAEIVALLSPLQQPPRRSCYLHDKGRAAYINYRMNSHTLRLSAWCDSPQQVVRYVLLYDFGGGGKNDVLLEKRPCKQQ